MIPLRDTEPVERVPWLTWLLIAANIGVLAYELVLPERELAALIQRYAVHPAWYGAGLSGLLEAPRALVLPLFTNLFLHGGIAHLVANMWSLWIFGDNVEDRLGHARFALFYVLAGLLANAVHIAMSASSEVPTIGASGAIAGVMGAYLVAFPRARITVLTPMVLIPLFVQIPAVVFLGAWFVFQLAESAFEISQVGGSAGIAWFAHIGGFLAGIALLVLLGGARATRRRVRTA